MASVIQNHNTNLLKDPVASTAKECSCRQKPNCPLAEKCLSEWLVYHTQVDRSDINQPKKNSNSVTTAIPFLSEIKVKN